MSDLLSGSDFLLDDCCWLEREEEVLVGGGESLGKHLNCPTNGTEDDSGVTDMTMVGEDSESGVETGFGFGSSGGDITIDCSRIVGEVSAELDTSLTDVATNPAGLF